MPTPCYIDEIPNYRAFIQRLREVLEGSEYDLLSWELRAPKDGYRAVTVYMKNGPPLTWNQPWEGDSI